jgi:hypothetical protein
MEAYCNILVGGSQLDGGIAREPVLPLAPLYREATFAFQQTSNPSQLELRERVIAVSCNGSERLAKVGVDLS